MTDQWADPRGYGATAFYWCAGCRTEIKFAQVEIMGRIQNPDPVGELPEPSTFFLSHRCDCQPGHIFERQFQVDHGAIKRLLAGFRPMLPYRAAPGEPQRLSEAAERAIAVFAWECQSLEDVDEFLLLCSRPPKR